MLTARAPDEVVVRLIVGVHVAIVEVHVPRVRGIIGIRRRRPIVGRLDALSAHFGQVNQPKYREIRREDLPILGLLHHKTDGTGGTVRPSLQLFMQLHEVLF